MISCGITQRRLGILFYKQNVAIQNIAALILLSIYLSIYGIYIAPLQGNYSGAFPAQARAKRKVLRGL